MNVLGDLVARDRRTDAVALRAESRAESYSYEKLCTTAWKAGNLLRHYGVRSGVTVAIDTGDAVSPPPLVAFVGAAMLGATTTFEAEERTDARVLVTPADRASDAEAVPGQKVLAYGGERDDPAVSTFEREVWSENPTRPPETVTPGEDVLLAGGERFSHQRLLAATRRVASDADVAGSETVALRGPLTDPGVLVAGVLAPLSVGATVLLDGDSTGDVGVGDAVPEARRVDPETVFE